MLDAIADFWKPVKRMQSQMRLKPEELVIGSIVGFGFVPQPSLSGRRMTVTAINTYKFGTDILTSFVLSQEKDAGASMIIAETGGEQYIAMSRRISISDRNRLFTHEDIDAVISKEDAADINVRDITPEYKGWIAPHYKRELHGVKGHLYKGDHRAGLMTGAVGVEFAYTLMVSDNHEHALEIEKYEDGRVEVYATVYRRMSDVGEVTHPDAKDITRPDVKLVSGNTPTPAPAKPAPQMGGTVAAEVPQKKVALEAKAPDATPSIFAPKEVQPAAPEAKQPETKPEPKQPEVQKAAFTTPVKLKEFDSADVVKKEEPEKQDTSRPTFFKPITVPAEEAAVTGQRAPQPEKPAAATVAAQAAEPVAVQAASQAAIAKSVALPDSSAPVTIKSNSQPYTNQEIKAVNNETSNFVNESIDCELHVANRIIDEAIRQEMRINDVVRKVIGLPVSQQESVQIPVTLTDQDYALLAIRYGISGSDREAIKRRINEDLADFSGANKQRKAA